MVLNYLFRNNIRKNFYFMKYRLTEEQLNSLITESTIRILREASEDEGIGGAIGKGLGWLARKTANGFRDFGKNFGQQWGGQSQGQGQASNTETEQQSLTQMQQTIQTLSKQLASLQQIVNNGGGNTNAAGGGNTNAAGGGNAENGGNTAGGGDAANGENTANGGNAAGGGQNNAEILARQKSGNAANTPQNRPITKDSSQNTMANLMRNSVAKGNMEEANRKRKKQISEAKLNQIVSESIRKVLNGK